MNIRIEHDLSNIDKREWSDFILQHPDGNIFQTPEIVELYIDLGKFEPIALFALDEKNKIIGLLVAVIQKEKTDLLEY